MGAGSLPTGVVRTNRAVRRVCMLAVGALGGLVLAGSPAAGPAASDWQLIHHPALEGGGGVAYVHDVAAPEGRTWLAAGFRVDSDGVRIPSVWESGDGKRWRRIGLPPAPAAERRDGAYMLARRGSTVVAIGERFTDRVQNAAWFRRGGRWDALRDVDDPLLSFGGRIVAVTATPTGFVAVGSLNSASSSLTSVYSSTDGRAWRLHSQLPLAGERFQALDITAGAERLVVVGLSSANQFDGSIWTWKDGAWTRASPVEARLGGPGRQQVGTVAYKPGLGFVAGGMTTRGSAEVPAGWSSADGLAWKPLPADAFPFASGGAAVHDIGVTADGLVAAGNTPTGAVLWRSATGRRWTMTPAPSAPHVGGENVHVAATTQIVVISVAGEGRSDFFRRGPKPTWVVVDRPPAFPPRHPGAVELRDVAASTDRVVVVGQDAKRRPLVMLSRNARTWTRLPFPDRTARLYAVAVTRGTIAVAGAREVRGTPRVAVWVSSSGRRWEQFGGTRDAVSGAFVDLAPDRDRLLALAFEGGPRGLQTSVWSGRARLWTTDAILGNGEARALCVGPHGATAIAVRDGRSADQVVAWQRSARGRWSNDPDLIATNAEAHGCADAPFGTVVVGSDRNGASVAWSRLEPGARWTPTLLQTSNPAGSIYDATRDGASVLVTGSSAARGQLDLAVWRLVRSGLESIGGGDPVFSAAGGQDGFGIVGYRGAIVVVGRTGAGDGAIWVGRERRPGGNPPDGL
jgi:hypothetical protein